MTRAAKQHLFFVCTNTVATERIKRVHEFDTVGDQNNRAQSTEANQSRNTGKAAGVCAEPVRYFQHALLTSLQHYYTQIKCAL